MGGWRLLFKNLRTGVYGGEDLVEIITVFKKFAKEWKPAGKIRVLRYPRRLGIGIPSGNNSTN
jgi:hypothetical protein